MFTNAACIFSKISKNINIVNIVSHDISEIILICNLCSRNIYFNHQLSMRKINVLNNIFAENVRMFLLDSLMIRKFKIPAFILNIIIFL